MMTIMVVDDMELFREPIAAALRSRGFEVVTAGDGQSALTLARQKALDLVLLDLAMPKMDGLAVLSCMRSDVRLATLPVILLTAVAEREYVIRAAKLGAKHYLLKTQFSIDQLVEKVRSVLSEHDAASSTHTEDPVAPAHVHDGGARADASPHPAAKGDADTAADSAERLKTMRPLMKRSEIFDHIDNAGELRGLSPTVARVMKLTEQESSTAEEIAKAVKQDSAVAIKMLRLANSVAFSRGQVIDTVEKAVARLGVTQVRQCMLNFTVIQHFAATEMCRRVNVGRFWEHAIGCGIIAAEIASRRGQEAKDLAFTMGLTHDLGRLLFMQEIGETYEQVLQTADELGLPLEQVESRLLMLNHAEVMDKLLHSWHFPKELIDPVVFHHLSIADIRHMAAKRVHEVVALSLADRLCHAMLIGDSGNRVLYPIAEHCAALEIDAEVITRIEQIALKETSDLKLALMAESSDGGWTDVREEVRRQLPDAFRPLVVSDEPAFDSVRIWCDQLRDADSEAPNMVIVHAHSSASVSALMDRAARIQREEGVSDLPLLALLPGDETQPHILLDRRVQHQLRMPVPEHLLVDAINVLLDRASNRMAA